MINQKKSWFWLGLLLLVLPTIGLGCQKNITPEPVTLNYWRVFDNDDSFKEIIANYKKSHPYVTINYRKLRFEEYEQLILEGLAEDKGPDIFSIHNTWIGKYQSKISPLPPTTSVAEQRIEGTFRKKEITEIQTKRSLTPAEASQSFIDVVGNDIVRKNEKGEEQIYGLPLGVDTLVMFYNREILNNSGISTVPENWTDFLKDVARITKLNEAGQIVVGGAALGTANNIPRFSDILSVLMMQNGAEMTDKNNYATWQLVPKSFPNKSYVPGVEALRFYTDFANPTKEAYTWNEQMPDALEAFTQGRVAFFFGYSYNVPIIQSQAPQLNWGMAKIPQADSANNQNNFANYWVETVSKKSKNQDVAWDFIQFAANAKNVKPYLESSGKPTALRSLIDEQLKNHDIEPAVSQLLTSKSWYKGKDSGQAEKALADLITAVINGTGTLEK